MILIPLLLSAGLDMSLPEFQPVLDESGNYIVSSYDVSENEFSVEYIPAEDFAEVSLSPSAEILEVDSPEVIDAPVLRSSDNSISGSVWAKHKIDWVNMVVTGNYNYSLLYIYCEVGYTFTFTTNANLYYISSLSNGEAIHHISNSEPFTPSENVYVICENLNNNSLSATFETVGSGDVSGDTPGGDVSGDTPGGDVSGDEPNNGGGSFDDTLILSKLTVIYNCLRAICFVLVIQFLYPLSVNIVRNIVGGDKNV